MTHSFPTRRSAELTDQQQRRNHQGRRRTRPDKRDSSMTYRNVVSAVVRALAAETINSAGGVDFEPKVQAARVPGAICGKEEDMLTDCWVHGRLHKALPVGLWLALVAKYSTHLERKHDAMMALAGSVKSPAPGRFIQCAVATWA